MIEVKGKTVGKTLRDVKADALVGRFFLTRYQRWWLRQMQKHLTVRSQRQTLNES